ncbi:alcohol oxidase [Violaceomyces palustris]|uniref:Alcohol oxidase n=1 Tax=Violaceomyces palustris TaxID=1673888 RepID=A0ACD0NUA9_9BASI|nr:alcohol oxidase [Violaceomyces palustris]
MHLKSLALAGAVLALPIALVQLADARRTPFGSTHPKRDLTSNGNDFSGKSFDYIVVGGGLAGLTVASRLSEDPSVSVAVIEAGSSGYEANEKFVIPAANLYDSSVGTQYDWQWKTVPQAGLNGREAPWPRGKVLGGSSAINGLYYVRASKREHDSWAAMVDAPEIWGWDNMLRAMKKSEIFTPPTSDVLDVVDIPYDASSHGSQGNIHVSWPGKTYPAVQAFVDSAANMGTPKSQNPNNGESWGTFVATSIINPSNWTRSFSRTGYLDPYTYRPNLHVLTGHQVTKVLFDTSDAASGNVVATGVQYAASASDSVKTVSASREVILSGGAINSPALLQLSGIADAGLLAGLDIDVVVDLPGVGYHVQDHLSTGVTWSPNDNNMAPARLTGDAETDSYVNSAISYVNLTTLFGNYSQTLISNVRDNMSSAVNGLSAPSSVKAGYNATYSAQVNDIFNSPIGPIELLFAMSFGSVQVQAALQHPLSRGSILIGSSNPFDSPRIDPGYLSNPTDMEILRAGFKLARQVGNAAPLSNHVSTETSPGSSVSTDAEWDTWIRNTVGTEYHPSCSCSMLPRELGGVVDKNLKVYGTKNLRVIDSSVPPISLSAHLMAATWGIAEIGAEMILAEKNGQTYQGSGGSTSSGSSSSSSKPSSTSTTSSPGATSSGSGSASSGASSTASPVLQAPFGSILALAVVGVGAICFA